MKIKLKILQTWCFVLWISIVSSGFFLYMMDKNRILSIPSVQKIESSESRKVQTVQGGKVVDTWVAMEGAELYYFSAYFDRGKVMLITIAERKETKYNITCFFFNIDGKSLNEKTDGELYYIPEDHDKRYTAAFVHCKMPYGSETHAVGLTTSEFKVPLFNVPIRHANQQRRFGLFTVCISPLRLEYDERHDFVEMMELNRVLGADYFVVYNFDISLSVTSILDFYINQGLLEVIPWQLPSNINVKENSSLSNIHYFGQLAAINDCIYRSKSTSRFVVNQDIDEFIIPRKHGNWFQMIESFPPRFNSYMFRSTFFRRSWPDVNESHLLPEDRNLAKKYKSFTILKQLRETEVFRKRIRTKYIVNPKCVRIAGVHQIYNYSHLISCSTYITTVSIALVHHYRYIEEGRNVPRTLDSSIMTFKDKLLHNLQNVWTKLNRLTNTTK